MSALLATEQLSPVAQQLSYLLENQAHLFPAAVDQHLVELATAAKLASSQPLDGKLETRISVLRASEARSAEVAHILGLQVLARCAADGVELNVGVPGLDDEACGGRVTPDSLSRLLPHEPGAVHEMRAHIDAVMRDGASPTAVCRVDAVSGGRLYAGSVQFGYFLRSVISSRRPLLEPELRVLASTTRSEEAWRCVRARSAKLWGLHSEASRVDDFSTGVTIAPTAAQSEFYAEDSDSMQGGTTALPSSSSLLSLYPMTLRDLIAEAVLWGWHLRDAEASMQASCFVGPGWSLLTQRVAPRAP